MHVNMTSHLFMGAKANSDDLTTTVISVFTITQHNYWLFLFCFSHMQVKYSYGHFTTDDPGFHIWGV